MFDLNKSIKLWRASLGAQPEISGGDIDELEDHLREEFDALKSQGLADDEAFLISSRRLGKAEDLCGEFAIADPARRRKFRLSWMIFGALALMLLWLAAEVITNFSAGFFSSFQGTTKVTQNFGGLGWVAGIMKIIILGLGCMFVWRLLANDSHSHRIKNLSGGAVFILSVLLAMFVLTARIASKAFLIRTLVKDDFMNVAVTGAYFNLVVLLVLPIVLLAGLWRLSKA